MAEQIIENYRIISTNLLVKAIKEVNNNSERFCFILGSGASASSNIPVGGALERSWMAEMESNPGFAEIRMVAKNLRENNHLDHDFQEIERAWEAVKNFETPMSSDYYFDIYKLRFFPNHRNGYHYLEKIMVDAKPSFGYHSLALMLTSEGGNNLVITTNFDSLVEDALFMYTNSKPLVINHELLADYAGDRNINRPIIAKVHRGIFFDPLNRPEETDELKGKWHDVLASVFQSYTPIVIGYGGGDNSLMEFLSEKDVAMKNGIYWCYVGEHGLPSDKIQNLVQQKKGYLVRTAGFDAVMLAIGNALFPDRIGVYETEQYLRNQTNMQIENYEKEYKKLTECEMKSSTADAEQAKSKDEFRKEIEKMEDRELASENERQAADKMSAWDYWRQGQRYNSLKQYDKAIKSYTSAIGMQLDIATFYNDRGCAHDELGEHNDAIRDYNIAIELDPNFAVYYYNRGCSYDDLGEYEKSISDYNKAIELDPDFVNAYNNRAVVYISLGKYEMAVADSEKAILIQPDFANPYRHCGKAWKEKGKFNKALRYYTKAIELDPKYKKTYLDRAEVYRLLGENEKAEADEATAEKL